MRKIYKTPTGKDVLGTLERLWGVALASGPDENNDPKHEGTTDVWWNDQETVYAENGDTHLEERVWIGEDYTQWYESQLVIVEVNE